MSLTLVSGQVDKTPYTPEIIITTGSSIIPIPISFFNYYNDGTYTAVLEKNSPALSLESSSVYVSKDNFGFFNLIVGDETLKKGIYFDNLLISNEDKLFQKIPIILGMESKNPDYDLSISFDQASDVFSTQYTNEVVISPTVKVYKLNYDELVNDDATLGFFVYDLEGNLLHSSERIVSISTQTSFEIIANIEEDNSEVILYASIISDRGGVDFSSHGLDLLQISLGDDLLFSLPIELKEYSSKIYIGLFLFLLSSIVLVVYLWYVRHEEETEELKKEINDMRKPKVIQPIRR